jgi:hypothetical protein
MVTIMTSPKPPRSNSARTAAVVVAVAAVGLLASPAGGASLPPKTAGAASAGGTITVNGKTTKIRYGYAHQVKGFFDPKKNDVEILLSDTPLSGTALTDSFARKDLADSGAIHTFEITLNAKGVPVSSSFHHGGFTVPSPSGLDSADVFTKRTFTAKSIDASYKSAAEHEFFGDTYAFDVTFRLAIAPRTK